MKFVKSSDLKVGMRLARPIYNKNGVLLYERNSKLTVQGISSIYNFGLIGIFILEPAEPVPPMTKEDIEFERFQTMTVFAIQEELTSIAKNGKSPKTQIIVGNIIKNYGHMTHKLNLIQSLRSKEDYTFKHTLNVAIMCALMTHTLNMKVEDQLEIMIAALVHDVGMLRVGEIDSSSPDAQKILDMADREGLSIIESVFSVYPNVKRICQQASRIEKCVRDGGEMDAGKIVRGSKILAVADTYDKMTAMQLDGEPHSEVTATRFLMTNNELFGEYEVNSLIDSINILAPGTSVELNTGEKGLVLATNPNDILRPMVLTFEKNSIVDLGNTRVYGDLEIVDIMKTLDNRYIMNTDVLKKSGFQVDEPEYVDVPQNDDDDFVDTPIGF